MVALHQVSVHVQLAGQQASRSQSPLELTGKGWRARILAGEDVLHKPAVKQCTIRMVYVLTIFLVTVLEFEATELTSSTWGLTGFIFPKFVRM